MTLGAAQTQGVTRLIVGGRSGGPYNCLLVRAPDALVLVDTGLGLVTHPFGGRGGELWAEWTEPALRGEMTGRMPRRRVARAARDRGHVIAASHWDHLPFRA